MMKSNGTPIITANLITKIPSYEILSFRNFHISFTWISRKRRTYVVTVMYVRRLPHITPYRHLGHTFTRFFFSILIILTHSMSCICFCLFDALQLDALHYCIPGPIDHWVKSLFDILTITNYDNASGLNYHWIITEISRNYCWIIAELSLKYPLKQTPFLYPGSHWPLGQKLILCLYYHQDWRHTNQNHNEGAIPSSLLLNLCLFTKSQQ